MGERRRSSSRAERSPQSILKPSTPLLTNDGIINSPGANAPRSPFDARDPYAEHAWGRSTPGVPQHLAVLSPIPHANKAYDASLRSPRTRLRNLAATNPEPPSLQPLSHKRNHHATIKSSSGAPLGYGQYIQADKEIDTDSDASSDMQGPPDYPYILTSRPTTSPKTTEFARLPSKTYSEKAEYEQTQPDYGTVPLARRPSRFKREGRSRAISHALNNVSPHAAMMVPPPDPASEWTQGHAASRVNDWRSVILEPSAWNSNTEASQVQNSPDIGGNITLNDPPNQTTVGIQAYTHQPYPSRPPLQRTNTEPTPEAPYEPSPTPRGTYSISSRALPLFSTLDEPKGIPSNSSHAGLAKDVSPQLPTSAPSAIRKRHHQSRKHPDPSNSAIVAQDEHNTTKSTKTNKKRNRSHTVSSHAIVPSSSPTLSNLPRLPSTAVEEEPKLPLSIGMTTARSLKSLVEIQPQLVVTNVKRHHPRQRSISDVGQMSSRSRTPTLNPSLSSSMSKREALDLSRHGSGHREPELEHQSPTSLDVEILHRQGRPRSPTASNALIAPPSVYWVDHSNSLNGSRAPSPSGRPSRIPIRLSPKPVALDVEAPSTSDAPPLPTPKSPLAKTRKAPSDQSKNIEPDHPTNSSRHQSTQRFMRESAEFLPDHPRIQGHERGAGRPKAQSPHQVQTSILKDISSLRRITASPEPNASQSYDSNSSTQPAPVERQDPLYLTLTDALSHSYTPHPTKSRSSGDYSLPQHNSLEAATNPALEDHQGRLNPSHPYRPTRDDNLTAASGNRLPSVQSDLSSIVTDEHRLSNGDPSLSGAAQELFEALEDDSNARTTLQDVGEPTSLFPSSLVSSKPSEGIPNAANHDQNLPSGEPPRSDLPSTPSSSSWRATLLEGQYETLSKRYGIFEMRRQEVIWSLAQSEAEFVHQLDIVLKLFIQPLKLETDGQWIPGLDPDVAKLFDWLDDIAQLHSQLSDIMQGCQVNQLPIVTQIAESLRPFVSKLELHQPYLVKVEQIIQSIERMSEDPESDFGEFIRIQTSSAECDGWRLTELLRKPVERLFKYSAYFKDLLALTPRSHPDYMASFSLLHSTEMVVRVLQTVKVHEIEYEGIKALSSRIRGLPAGFQLASRDRHLVAQGPLLRVSIQADAAIPEMDYTPIDTHNSSYHPSVISPDNPNQFTSRLSPSRPKPAPLNTAFIKSERNYHHNQEDDYTYTSQSSSMSNTSGSSDELQTPSSHYPNISHGQTKPHSTSSQDEWIYVFVFTDVVLLCTSTSRSGHRRPSTPHFNNEGSDTWDLLPDVGLGRVLGFSDLSNSSNEHLICVDILPLDEHQPSETHQSAITVYLSLAQRITGRLALAPEHVLQEARRKWTAAFQRCYIYTLRSLSFPASYTPFGTTQQNGQKASDSIISVLASGLPLPKSPSLQLRNPLTLLSEQEREERGWWAYRFQTVLKEMSARDELESSVNVTPQPQRRNIHQLEEFVDDHHASSPPPPRRPVSLIKESRVKLFKSKKRS